MPDDKLPERLVRLRLAHGLNRKQLSSAIGVPYNTIMNYETGKNKVPQKFVVRLADYYGISTDEILGVETERPAPAQGPRRVVDGRRLYDFLIGCGLITPGHDLSDGDRKFLIAVINAISDWFEE